MALTQTNENFYFKIAHSGKIQARKTSIWVNETISWQEFVKRFQNPVRTQETFSEFKKMPKSRQDDLKDVGGYVGGVCRDGMRRSHTVEDRQLICLDIDNAKESDVVSKFKNNFYGSTALFHTTRKHERGDGRWRLIVPLSRPVDRVEYEAIARCIANIIGIEMFDSKTFEYERLMYFPSVSRDSVYEVQCLDGIPLHVESVLSRYESHRDASTWARTMDESTTRQKAVQDAYNASRKEVAKTGLIGAFLKAYNIHEAIEKYLCDVYVRVDEQRYTYLSGTTIGGMYVFDDGDYAFSHHASDPVGMGGRAVNAFDLVRIHKYGGGEQSSDTDKKDSMRKMFMLCDADDKVQSFMPENERKTKEDIDWMKLLSRDEDGGIHKTIDNVYIILSNDENLKGKITYNLFDQSIYGRCDLPWTRHHKSWSDSDDKLLASYIEKKYKIYSKEKLDIAVEKVASENISHPIREYLETLSWDGIERVDSALVEYLGADDTQYVRSATRKMFCAAVARAYDPGCKFDYVLCLLGAQGIGKSTFLKKIGRSWYSDSLVSLEGESAMMALRGTWIVEIAEMSAKERARINAVKMFLSKQVDRYRPKYARREMDFPRQNVFIATTNDNVFLSDPTGNRRFLPIDCVNHCTKNVFDLDDFTVGQIWAEAVHMYKSGEKLYLSNEIELQARDSQESHTDVPELVSIINSFLDRPITPDWYELSVADRIAKMEMPSSFHTIKREFISVVEIWRECFREFTPTPPRDRIIEIRNSLKFLGWKPCKRRIGSEYGHVNGYKKDGL